ncbi:unnamed protein product, partial [marine sediment metagenome]
NTFVRKSVPRIVLVARNRTNVDIQINSINNDGTKTSPLVPFRFISNITWGDEDIVWGQADLIWNFTGLLEGFRRFPTPGVRCLYKQIQLTNADVNIANSDTVGTATVDEVAKTVTILGGGVFASDIPDYEISFEGDSYTRKFTVTAVSGAVLTYSDAANLSVGGTPLAWQLSGKRKGAVLELVSLTMNVGMLTRTQTPFSGDAGANA